MSLMPESGKPIDLEIDRIKTVTEATTILAWLDSLIVNMQHQILQHILGRSIDDDWLVRVRAALRATIHTRFKVGEIKNELENNSDRHQSTT